MTNDNNIKFLMIDFDSLFLVDFIITARDLIGFRMSLIRVPSLDRKPSIVHFAGVSCPREVVAKAHNRATFSRFCG